MCCIDKINPAMVVLIVVLKLSFGRVQDVISNVPVGPQVVQVDLQRS